MFGEACPCGSGDLYAACCGPLHDGVRQAETPEQLMRSRYAAYAKGRGDYVFRTWHPRTRPAEVHPDPDTTWTRLDVIAAHGSEVEFRAHHVTGGRRGTLHERSRFEQRAGRWFYLDAAL